MKLYSLFTIILIVLLLSQQSKADFLKKAHKKIKDVQNGHCPTSRLMACAPKIQSVVLKCSSDMNAVDCIENFLADQSCYPCIGKVIPHFQEVEQYRKKGKERNEKLEQETLDINNVVNSFATCGQVELFECRMKVQRVIKQCSKSLECVQKALKRDPCQNCICQVDQSICKNNKDNKDLKKKEVLKKIASEESFSFLGDLQKLMQKQDESHSDPEVEDLEEIEKEESGNSSLFGNLGKLINGENLEKLQQISDIINNKKPEKAQKQQEKYEKKHDNDFENKDKMMEVVQQMMMDPRATGRLIDQLKIKEQDLEGDDYEEIQAKITEKILENPEAMEQFMGQRLNKSQMQDMMNYEAQQQQDNQQQEGDEKEEEDDDDEEEEYSEDDDDDDDEDYLEDKEIIDEDVKKCENKEQLEVCKWKIVKIMPSCVDSDVKMCLQGILGNGKCNPCICKVLPEFC